MFVRRFWDAWRLLKSLSGEEHHSQSEQESDGTQPKPWGLCLPISWEERADIRSELGSCKQEQVKLPAQVLAHRSNVCAPSREAGRAWPVGRVWEKETQVGLGTFCSQSAAAVFPGLCCVLRPRCWALHFPSFSFPAPVPFHRQEKALTYKAEHLDEDAALISLQEHPNSFPVHFNTPLNPLAGRK